MSMSVLGREQLVRNFSRYSEDVVRKVVTHTEIVQAKVVNFARANHPYTDRTQNLTNSIQPGRIEVNNDRVQAEVLARMAYASFLEFGTSRMRAFPFMHPALVANIGEFRSRIAMAAREARP